MKNLIYILLFFLLPVVCLGQEGNRTLDERTGLPIHEKNEFRSDSVKTENVAHFRRSWQWSREGVYRRDVTVDTTFDDIQNYNYIFRKNTANTYLGNFPSPYLSDIFILRDAEEDFFPLSSIRSFLFRTSDALLYNTTTPFTQLVYFTGGGKGKNETMLDVWHVQNIRPYWNAGVRYNLISSDGRYMNQKSKAYNFSFFSSYERERMAASLFVNQNNGVFNENGGITDRYFIRDTTMKAEDVPVNLSDARNAYRNFNFNFQVQYNIGKSKLQVNGEDSTFSYPAKAVVTGSAEDNVHRFREDNVNRDFFPVSYIDSVSNLDIQENLVYSFSTRFVVNEHPKYTYLPGIYAGVDFKYLDYRERTSLDTINNYGSSVYTGTWLTAGIFNVDTTALLTYDVAGKLGVVGHYAGNFRLDGYVRQYLSKSKMSYVHARALFELKSVNHFFTRYIGNHDIWINDFKPVKTLSAEAKYVNERMRTEVGVGLSNTIDYVYFDADAVPRQASNILVVTAWAKQKFRAGKHFHFDQTVYYQRSSDDAVLSLPELALYSHNYYNNQMFNKALELNIGFDLFYNTRFYADKYRPSLMQFYNQQEEKTGGYPKLDVFVNFRIKRAVLFAKYEHVNYYFTNGQYFSALNYPINPAMFKFGLRWNFFD